MYFGILLAVGIGAIMYLFLTKKKEEPVSMGDGWWGKGEKPGFEEDASIRPFKVETSEAEINYLHRRLDEARLAESLDHACFHYGFNSAYLKKVISYWRNQFDWKKQIEVLNKYPQFKTKIEGIDVHFLHVKPLHVPEGRSVKPLLMVHGWPASFFAFYKMIPILLDPVSHGLSSDYCFEIICPSVPGYGFSEAPHKKGFKCLCAARIFYKMMLRLGFREFYVQGADWGWLICTSLAQIAPSHVKGLHINTLAVRTVEFKQLLSLPFGRFFPRLLGFYPEDIQRVFPLTTKFLHKMVTEFGYLHLQATKPDTIGYALTDSPVGLAAYILEKFSAWTDSSFRYLEDGGLEKKFSLEDLLTNIMIYWVSGCITSSMRFYKENAWKALLGEKYDKLAVRVPTGIASFPNEPLHFPRPWVEKKYANVVSFNYMPRGGHFGALEEPELLAADIVQFVEKVEKANVTK
ncbi:Epoxide hydrolase 1 [Varanus komodoensis]|uniref:Epoxide hydrolase n=2 Tax=Varanus komodoensis TaxID=61221 RepID=A0A8D2LMF3_VARKO|nr:Epoxide hydrolase 1 [Varanus komodoensis]